MPLSQESVNESYRNHAYCRISNHFASPGSPWLLAMRGVRNRNGEGRKTSNRKASEKREGRSEPGILSTVAGSSLFSLPPEKVALHRALAERERKLGQIYEGALRTLADTANPDCLALAAHGFRELMEKFAHLVAVPLRVPGENLKNKVQALRKPYARMKKKCDGHSKIVDGNGQLIKEMSQFMMAMDELFSWADEIMPSRKTAAVKLLQRLEPSARQLPSLLQEVNAQYWEKIHNFFAQTCHHSMEPSRDDAERWVGALEHFLLDRLIPRTTRDFVRIDAILSEAKRNDQI